MTGPIAREVLLENQETLLTPAEGVANTMYHHPLSYGLLVLSKVGYSRTPVLGKDNHFVGLVSLPDMVNKMTDLQTIGMNPLEGLTAADVTGTDVPMIDENWELEEVLHLLVDSPSLLVVIEERVFKGIIVRKELFRTVNFMACELKRRNILSSETEELKE